MTTFANISFFGYTFHALEWFILALLLALLYHLKLKQHIFRKDQVRFSKPASALKQIQDKRIPKLLVFRAWIIYGGLLILGLALSKPVKISEGNNAAQYGEGIDILLSMDISGSMMATDFQPNRLEAAKEVAKEFIDSRPADRIGLVVYEGEAYTACPATLNHDFLKTVLSQVQSGWLEPGTAIGVGLGTAVARLRNEDSASKVVILLSDGENNKGSITPLEAAALALTKNVRVYTIGVGKEGFASMPVQTPFGTIIQNTKVSIDEKLLTEIAAKTGGQYFRATDNNSLREIYKTIDRMEKSKIAAVNLEKAPPFSPAPFLLIGGLLLFAGLLLELLILKKYV